ncbi:MAG: GNAT family N-acetyltransferase [Pseudonocardia sp.]
MTEPLLHICSTADWRAALAAGELHPTSLDDVGFVHLSSPEHVHRPANRLFRGHTDLVLLCIDPELAAVDLYWEPGDPPDPDVPVFPHAYGAIATRAVTAVLPYLPGRDGSFAPLTDVPDRGDLPGRSWWIPYAMALRQASRIEWVTGGFAVLAAGTPESFNHNQLVLDALVPVEVMLAEADDLLGGAGVRHRAVTLRHPDSAGLAAELAGRGFRIDETVVMARRAGPGHSADRPAQAVTEVEAEQLRAWWAERTRRNNADITADAVEQLTQRRLVSGEVIDMRYLAVRVDGAVAAAASLAIDGATAWIDAIDTDPAHRRRGYGEAVLRGCLATAEAAGCDLVVLDALVTDWPRDWYARRGFTEVANAWMAILLVAE